MTKTLDIRDTLFALDGGRADGKPCRVAIERDRNGKKDTSYLSGGMYLMTGFAERAYVFANRDEAQAVVRMHRDELPAGTIVYLD